MPGYSETKEQHLARLRRIEGQVRGLQRMIDDDTYCIDVITQVAAISKALQGVALGLVHEHLAHCVAHAVQASPEAGDEKIREATAAIERLLRT
jgi:DNA-binding FrmR family transcriptional regulator